MGLRILQSEILKVGHLKHICNGEDTWMSEKFKSCIPQNETHVLHSPGTATQSCFEVRTSGAQDHAMSGQLGLALAKLEGDIRVRQVVEKSVP